MKTAIIYATSHGTTEKVANLIMKGLNSTDVSIINLKEGKTIDLSLYDTIIIGGSIHAGSIQASVKEFCKKNLVELLQKRVALYVCAMNEPEFESELKNAFPELLYNHAYVKEVVGGEFLFDKMNFIEKMLVRNISGIKETTSKINHSKINLIE